MSSKAKKAKRMQAAATAIKTGPPPAPASTAIQAAPPVITLPPSEPVAAEPLTWRGLGRTGLQFLASLRLTVALFVLSFILVFCGTLAMVEIGNQTAVDEMFRSLIAWIPLKTLTYNQVDVPGAIPYPGGWLLGGLLFTNLLAAHAMRFKISWKRAGILLTHSGLVIMMVGEFVAGVWQVEGRLTIPEGYASNYHEHFREVELAVVQRRDAQTDDEVVIPDRFVRAGGLIQNELLPFDIDVGEFMVNSATGFFRPGEDRDNPADRGTGTQWIAVKSPEISGANTEGAIDMPSAYVTLKRKDTGEKLGTYLLSTWFSMYQRRPDDVIVDGKRYEISLRFKRTYKSYTVFLKQFHHEFYPGTDKPRNYQADVHFTDPSFGDDFEFKIYMNHPLRHRGETFFQSSLNPHSYGTVLQVVRNPGWLLPYISCGVVTLGLLIHFGIHLVGFIRRSLA